MDRKKVITRSAGKELLIIIAVTGLVFAVASFDCSWFGLTDPNTSAIDSSPPTPSLACSVIQRTPVVFAAEAGQDSDQNFEGIQGGDIPALRYLMDPYPAYSGIALDTENDLLVIGDTNRKSLMIYNQGAGNNSDEITTPLRQIIGPDTLVGFVAGVEVDPVGREMYAVNNDIEDSVVVFSYDAKGNPKPSRVLGVPHGGWGVALNRSRDEVAITIQNSHAVLIYRREAEGVEAPTRIIEGRNTGLADPHGIDWDKVHGEITVANWGNWGTGRFTPSLLDPPPPLGGRIQPPSITVFAETAGRNAKPLRTIQGSRTRLNWPMEVEIDPVHNEIFVANNGDNSVLAFRREDVGNVSPARTISGNLTGIDRPMGVAVDLENDELLVANFGAHTTLVFARTAQGNVPPKRIIRNAPAGTPTCGFGNPMAVAYDSRREEILVPN